MELESEPVFTEKIEFLGFHESTDGNRVIVLLELIKPIKSLSGKIINKLPFYFSTGRSGGADKDDMVPFHGICVNFDYNYLPGELLEKRYAIWNKYFNLDYSQSVLYQHILDNQPELLQDEDIKKSLHFLNKFFIKCYVNTPNENWLYLLKKTIIEEHAVLKSEPSDFLKIIEMLTKIDPIFRFIDDFDPKFCNHIFQNIKNKYQYNQLLISGKNGFLSLDDKVIPLKKLSNLEVNEKIGNNNIYGFNINLATKKSRIDAFHRFNSYIQNYTAELDSYLISYYKEDVVCLPLLSEIYDYLLNNKSRMRPSRCTTLFCSSKYNKLD